MNSKRWPANASNSRWSRTRECSSCACRRAVRHRYTRTLAGGWITRATRPARCATWWRPLRRRCATARHSTTATPDSPPSQLPAAPAPLDQCEAHWFLTPEPFAQAVKGVPRQPPLLVELRHRQSPQLLLGDPLAPPIVISGRLDYGFAYQTTMQPYRHVGKRGSSDAYCFRTPDQLLPTQFDCVRAGRCGCIRQFLWDGPARFFNVIAAVNRNLIVLVTQTVSGTSGLGAAYHLTVEGWIDSDFTGTDSQVSSTPEPSAVYLCFAGLAALAGRQGWKRS
jgi:hypothetical protein